MSLLACGLLALAAMARTWPVPCVVLIAAALAAAGAADSAWRAVADGSRVLPRLAREGATVRACGVVLVRRPHAVEISVRSVRRDRGAWRVREPLRAIATRREHAATGRPGERVCATGELRPARPGRREPPAIAAATVNRAGVASPIRFAASIVRDSFSAAARRALPDTQAGLLLGMTEGDTTLLDDQTMEAFRLTGLAHLVAVSGANVAVFLALVVAATRLMVRRRRWLRAAAAAPPLLFFAFLTGLEPSVLRAVVTAGLVLVTSASGRTVDGLRLAGLTFLVLVLASPELLGQPGFQLSFGATVGLIVWAGPLSDRVVRALSAGREPGCAVRLLGEAVGTTLAAQIAVAPLLAIHFGRVPALGAVANLIGVPLAPMVMVGGMVTLGLGSLGTLIGWSFASWAPATMRLPLDVILSSARTFARLPAASIEIGPLVALAATAGAAAWLSRRARAPALALTVVASCMACGRGVASPASACREAEVRAIDVGQGTAILVRSAGHSVLVDGGPREGHVLASLRKLGINRLDYLVISHPHADHTDGLVDVISHLRVGGLVGPPTMSWGVGRRLVSTARSHGIEPRAVSAGETVRAGGIKLDVLAPEPGPAPEVESSEGIYAQNLVALVRVGSLRILLPGDARADGTQAMIDSGRSARAPVLIAPHHGSADVDPAFVDAVDPRLTIVTVGAANGYGFPTPTAMRIYQTHGPVLRTDLNGSIRICSVHGAIEARPDR
jgi:competence protein ComEC